MFDEENIRIIQESLRHLAAIHTGAVSEIERTMQVVAGAMETGVGLSLAQPTPEVLASHHGLPIADRPTLSILWKGQSCFLGNTLLFRFFERLALSPNRYITYSELLDDVWDGGFVESTTIRGSVKRLRDRLIAADMSDLARLVKGKEPGHYGLILV